MGLFPVRFEVVVGFAGVPVDVEDSDKITLNTTAPFSSYDEYTARYSIS